ncbi:Uncharacterised protein [Serratia fonticola]|uniref:Uncharacterized protein n=1 Tax=Serratia fonticola TaxID=47917 RepID=A0A4V6KXW1_SERFO|nr:Uncharacterised protein [Serratia fonticola]
MAHVIWTSLLEKKLLPELTPVSKQLDLMSRESEFLPDLSQPDLQKYNFVVFEQAINVANKELQRDLAEQSKCVVLVLDRSMSSSACSTEYD